MNGTSPDKTTSNAHPVTDRFYVEIESFDDFGAICDLDRYRPVPDDWQVVIADIQGSTDAIERGQYKNVNMVGAACITAVLNVTNPHEVPYVFGGDGANMVVPPGSMPAVRSALLKTRHLAKIGFGLELRVGAVPVDRLRGEGLDVLVAKFRLSRVNHLAVFSGGGVGRADDLIRGDHGDRGYAWKDDPMQDPPDLEGLSCRWEPLDAMRGKMVCILVRSLVADRDRAAAIYRGFLKSLIDKLDSDISTVSPVQPQNMVFRWPPRGLRAEATATKGNKAYGSRFGFIYVQSLVQWVMNRFDLRGGNYNAPVYREELRANSDYRRFDDTLRLILDCTASEISAVESLLEDLRVQGKAVYGLHQVDSALMTCLVFSLADSEHIHFIDGAEGGFAVAAKQMKQQLVSTLI